MIELVCAANGNSNSNTRVGKVYVDCVNRNAGIDFENNQRAPFAVKLPEIVYVFEPFDSHYEA